MRLAASRDLSYVSWCVATLATRIPRGPDGSEWRPLQARIEVVAGWGPDPRLADAALSVMVGELGPRGTGVGDPEVAFARLEPLFVKNADEVALQVLQHEVQAPSAKRPQQRSWVQRLIANSNGPATPTSSSRRR